MLLRACCPVIHSRYGPGGVPPRSSCVGSADPPATPLIASCRGLYRPVGLPASEGEFPAADPAATHRGRRERQIGARPRQQRLLPGLLDRRLLLRPWILAVKLRPSIPGGKIGAGERGARRQLEHRHVGLGRPLAQLDARKADRIDPSTRRRIVLRLAPPP